MFRGKKNKRDWDFIRETPTSRLIPTQQQHITESINLAMVIIIEMLLDYDNEWINHVRYNIIYRL